MENEEKSFRTLRGFLSGQETDEEDKFYYSASLRIFGDQLDFEDISSNLGLMPTNVHRKGDRKGEESPAYKDDFWRYSPDVDEEKELAEHIDSLWKDIKHAKDYLLMLKKSATVDVFLGYRSNNDMAGIEIPYTSLEMFIELQIPFGLSVVVL